VSFSLDVFGTGVRFVAVREVRHAGANRDTTRGTTSSLALLSRQAGRVGASILSVLAAPLTNLVKRQLAEELVQTELTNRG